MAQPKKKASSPPPVVADEQREDSEERLPSQLPVLPLGDIVLFPGMVVPLVVNTERSTRVIDEVVASDRHVITVLQRNPEISDDRVRPRDLNKVGCVARLIKMIKLPDETMRVLVQGISRCTITQYHQTNPYLVAAFRVERDREKKSLELTALSRNASQLFQNIVSMSPVLPDELRIAAVNMDDSGLLADMIAAHLNTPLKERQDLLADFSPISRLRKLMTPLNREMEVLQLGTKIQNEVSETFSKSQRDFFLREQLKAIQKELGEDASGQGDLKDMDARIDKARMPDDVLKVAKKERDRLNSIPPASPEYALVRNYLDWLCELPWSTETEDILDIVKAKKVLDKDHYDITKVKERILEFLAVLKLKHDLKGPILCFVGPPGVGKTSLGRSIARALGRKFVRMSLGGVHDEAEIRGHRRTYIGALPGRIIQGIRNAGTRNPVFMLDEVDKVGADFRGDPSSALLEVLDPEQNFSFSDHYLDVPFDLSHVLFITTANRLDTIPPPLRDRMEVIELAGYTRHEKLHIANKFLVPKQIKAHGLKRTLIAFTRDAIEVVISGYTREAGVRNLDRQLANICRKVARGIAEGKKRKVTITPARVRSMLGPRKFESEVAEKRMDPGVATGLAWTPTGGEILFIEATYMPGRGRLTLTGSLGDVMKESAQAALSYVRANAKAWKISDEVFVKNDIHIHVPGGAIPKDGPSAGLAMVVALVSALTRKPSRSDIAMTGEITLRGRVMPVGGIKEKVLAAARAGVKEVMLPDRNKNSLRDVPEEIREKIHFSFVKTATRGLHIALDLS